MMKKSTIIFLITFSIAMSNAFGQGQVVKTVFAAAGDAFTNAKYYIEWTIGETITETIDKKAFQGFHPPTNFTVSVQDVNEMAQKVSLYPNPISQNELLVQFKDWEGNAKLSIYDLQGRLLWQKEYAHVFNDTHNIDVHFLNDGSYLLSIQNANKPAIAKKFSVMRH